MALVSPKMGLAVWNVTADKFNHDQLADDFLKIDFHDHTPGRGKQIPTAGIEDGAITAAKLAPGSNAVQNGSITTPKFAALPAVKVYKDALTTCTSGDGSTTGLTTLTFNSERVDSTSTMHDLVTNTERLVAPVAGIYMITVSVQISAPPATGIFSLNVYKNGTTYCLGRSNVPTTALGHTFTTFTKLAANDYVLCRAINTTGGSINISASGTTSESANDFGMVWIAP